MQRCLSGGGNSNLKTIIYVRINTWRKRVRTEFNPSNDTIVDELKQKAAYLINLCEDLKKAGHDVRLVSLAQTAFEEAAMWAVKAATS